MDAPATPFDGSADGRDAIFRATYRVVYEDGYAALSIKRIADEADLSKSTIYHHFENKDELALEFASELTIAYLERYVSLVGGETDDALTAVERLLDLALFGDVDGERSDSDGDDATDVDRVYLEMRSRALTDPRYRTRFQQLDAMIRERLAALVREGIDEGTFRDVDPAAVAATLYVVLEGASLLGRTSADREWMAAVRDQLDAYLATITLEGGNSD
ncbi:TetR/AcrR family transcriptional regulator [Natronolimnohabitans innermongolicus]|uniref:DNA binding protein putative transcriptional regulator n=1 Tax=Natronolimnohabitans innermongolicus JCM 12255 TaxID=1227499 RepID=L9XIM7_9EURY|nr:TetR/AcrR family transcriptional regulator [Natronolimnohabitans innermongolicus]ELY61594.1 DNA binding protein putative transcriptional regulator [Natronolimnohabitans innermongolicus JCM 12255]